MNRKINQLKMPEKGYIAILLKPNGETKVIDLGNAKNINKFATKMTIKLFSPCPDDDGRTPMSNKKFSTPRKKFAPIDKSNMDFELERAKLDVLD